MAEKPKVLVVDDDPDISLALKDYLQQENFEVDVADTGNAALKKGLAHHYDALLLDVGLPDRDGIEILVELSRQKPELPIILLTAFSSLRKSTPPDTLQKAFAYLTKPYSREEVLQVLRRAVFGSTESESLGFIPANKIPLRFPSIVQPSSTSTQKGPTYQLLLEEYQRLAENIRLMEFAFDHVPEAILVADTSKRFRFANRAASQILGYNKEELKALGIPDIAPNHDNQRYQEHLNELRQGKTLSYFTTHRTKYGQEIPVEISVYLLNFHGQEFTCAITKQMPAQSTSSQKAAKDNRSHTSNSG
jgi:PAS domain S-box-containing protein